MLLHSTNPLNPVWYSAAFDSRQGAELKRIMTTIQLPKGIEGDLSFAQFQEICHHFNCELLGKTRSHEWQIESEDPANFYWLGANMAFRKETPLSISYVESIAQNNSKQLL
jgi:hypothetical protein